MLNIKHVGRDINVFEAQYEELIVTQQIRSSLNLSTNDDQALCQNA